MKACKIASINLEPIVFTKKKTKKFRNLGT